MITTGDPMSYYVHEVPGRLRIRIPSLKRNARFAVEIQTLLKRVPGVTRVSANTMTGSVVVHFDADAVTSHSILSFLSREGYIDLARAVSHEQYVESAVAKVGQVASKPLLGYALDRAFQGTPLALMTAFI